MTTRIRINWGDMPFDRRGVHATGREIYKQSLSGVWNWQPEYEDDDTIDLPETDPDYIPDYPDDSEYGDW